MSVSLAAQGYGAGAGRACGRMGTRRGAARWADARAALTLAQQGAFPSTWTRRGPWRWAAVSAAPSSTGCCGRSRRLRRLGDRGRHCRCIQRRGCVSTRAPSPPPDYRFAIPALGNPSRDPAAFLRFSPLYDVHSLPPTLLIHTAADEIIPIDQAYALEAALRAPGFRWRRIITKTSATIFRSRKT
ncbi:MAG: hypothetical protein R2854_09350 [Caldilineaceae bacterium]